MNKTEPLAKQTENVGSTHTHIYTLGTSRSTNQIDSGEVSVFSVVPQVTVSITSTEYTTPLVLRLWLLPAPCRDLQHYIEVRETTKPTRKKKNVEVMGFD